MLGDLQHFRLAGLVALMAGESVFAAAFNSKFLYPVIFGEIIHNGDVMPVQYLSNYTDPTLTMFCREPYKSPIIPKYQVQAPSGNATVDVKIDLTNIEGCWFNLKSDNEAGINTNAWKLFNNGTNPSTVSSSTMSSTATSTSSSSTTSTATSATTPATTPNSPTSAPSDTNAPASSQAQGMSADAKAGLGAGIAVAAVLFIGAMIFFCLTRRKVNTLVRKDQQYQHLKPELAPSQGYGSAAQSIISYPPPHSRSGTPPLPVYGGYHPQQQQLQQKQFQELQGVGPGASPYFAPQQYPYTTTVQVGGRQEMHTHEPTAQEIYTGEQRPQELGSATVYHNHGAR